MTVKLLSAQDVHDETYISETIMNGFFTVDHKWTVKYWNKAAEKLLGVLAKDIVNKNIWQEFAEIMPINFYAYYDKAFLHNNPIQFQEYWGEMGAWFDVVAFHCNDTLSVSFKSSSLIMPLDPISPQHPGQQLKIINKLYRIVTEVTNDCLYEWDLHAKEIFWIDGGHKRAFGYQIENMLIPQSFWESRIFPGDRDRVVNRLNKIIAEASLRIWEEEYWFQQANGKYAYVHERGHIIYDRNRKACRMIGATQDVTHKVLVESKLARERATKQREITEAVLTAQEKERTEIGKEMHENLNQVLAIAKMYIQMAMKSLDNREIYLNTSLDSISHVINEIRRISKNLAIPGIHIIGLFDNIRNLLKDMNTIHSIRIKFYATGISEEEINEKLQLNIFRIVQEQLNNIIKHSKATSGRITISKLENTIMLIVEDNGKGCNISEVKNGVGLINIKSRAELYQGGIKIVSQPGKGYQLNVLFSLKQALRMEESVFLEKTEQI